MKKLISLTISLVMLMMILPTAGIISVSAANSVDSFSIAGTESLYSGYNYSDPNYITDEDFFGKWDASTSTWTKVPYFNYEKYSALAEVEAAAKAGNYTLAREKITEYYKAKFIAQPREIETTGGTSSIIAAKLAAYNMYGASNFDNLDIINLPVTAGWVSADVTSIAQKAAESTSGKQYTFQIAAAKNDGIKGTVYSRESSDAPYVKATVNGTEKTFSVVADTYIRGGSYQSSRYGTSTSLYIEERPSFSSAGISFPYTTDSYSNVNLNNVMRARLTVDFSSLKSTDTVTDARLYIKGKATSEKPVVVQYKSDLGGKETDKSWSWVNSKRYYMCYDGLPGIAGFSGDNSSDSRYAQGNFGLVDLLTGVYRYTNDEIYAYHAFRFFNAQAKAWGNSATGGGNNLSLGTRASSIPVQFAKLATSTYFTAENVVPLLKYAWICGQGLVNCWDKQSEESNWGTYETAGLANLSINFKEFSVVDDPIADGGYGNGKLGGWEALVNHRYDVITGEVIRDDGSFTETMEYGREVVNNILDYPNYAKEAGESVTLSDALKNKIHQIATYILNVAGPDFCSTQYGDSAKYDYKFMVMARDVKNAIGGTPLINWAGTFKAQGSAPSYTSVLYPTNRKAALKTGWGTDDLYIDFSSDATVQSAHNHPDDLNISMFCYGKPLLVDSMQYNYGQNDARRLAVYATNNHNTLSIKVTNPTTGSRENVSHIQSISNIHTGPYPVYSAYKAQEDWDNTYYNRSRTAEPGVIHRSELNGGYDYVEMSHSNYEDYVHEDSDYASFVKADVNMKRSLLMLRDAKYMIVTDYVKALDSSSYTVAQNWHFMPGSNFTLDETTGIAKTQFSSEPNVQIIPVKAASAMDYVYEQEGYYCPSTGVIQNNPYPAYEKSGTGDKVYNTVILPTQTGQSVTSVAENLSLNVGETVASASHITMTDDSTKDVRDVYYYFLHDTSQKAQRTFGKYSADSKMALVEKYNSNTSMYVIQDGTNITDTQTGKILLSSESNLEELSVTINDGVMKIDSSKTIDLAILRIYSEETITKVEVNGVDTTFNYTDNYVNFVETIDFTAEENAAYQKEVTAIAGRYWQSTTPSSSKQLATDGDMTTSHRGNGKDADGNITGVSFTLDLEELHRLTEFTLYLPDNQPSREIKLYKGTEVADANLIATITSPNAIKQVNGVRVYELRSLLDNVLTSQLTVVYSGGSDFAYIEISAKGEKIKNEIIDFSTDENIAYQKKITHIAGRYWQSTTPSSSKQLATDGDMTTSHRGNGKDSSGNTTGVSFSLDLKDLYSLTEFALYMPEEQPLREIKLYKGTEISDANLIATIAAPEVIKIVNGVRVYELKSALDNVVASQLTVVYSSNSDFAYIEISAKGQKIGNETIDFDSAENIAYGKTITSIGGSYESSTAPSDTQQWATDGDVETFHSAYGKVDNTVTGVTFTIDLGKAYELDDITMFLGQSEKTYKIYKGTSVSEANLLATATPEGNLILVNGYAVPLEKVSATFPEGSQAQYLTFCYEEGSEFPYHEIYITGSEVVSEDPDNPPAEEYEYKNIAVTVDGAEAGEQVSLMVVPKDANLLTVPPLYLNQSEAGPLGEAVFPIVVSAAYSEVDVYAGYSSYAQENNNAVRKIGTVNLDEAMTEVTISNVKTEIISVEGKQATATGATLKFDVKASEGVSASRMIWAIRYKEDDKTKIKYTESFDVTDYGIGSLVEEGIVLGVTFLNGLKGANEIDPVAAKDIEAIDAIFLFTNYGNVFTNPDDEKNEKQ